MGVGSTGTDNGKKSWLAVQEGETMADYIDRQEEMKIVKQFLEEAKKACADCQEFNCDGCIYGEYRNE